MSHLLGVVFSSSDEMDIEPWSLAACQTGVGGLWNCRNTIGEHSEVVLGSQKVGVVKDGLFL
jgi:hypothetical protein